MTELEYVVSNFRKRFSAFSGKRIVIHGSRNYAEAIIGNFHDEFGFIGIMSNDPLPEKTHLGLPVLQESDLDNGDIDLIILTERVKYAEAVFQKIYLKCIERNIKLFNMYGLDEILTHHKADLSKHHSLNEWQTICSEYDVVALEVMDTVFFSNYMHKDFDARPVFKSLIPWLLKKGIDVRFSLRKSYSQEEQLTALKEQNFCDDLENRVIYRSGEDLSFRMLREELPDKKILYIGIGLVNEILLPQCYGIDTERYVNGRFDNLAPTHKDKPKHIVYDKELLSKTKAAILEHDIISFDIFDTLILRKTLYPDDVFEIVEKNASAQGIALKDFKRIRHETENGIMYATIAMIYDKLAEIYKWDADTREKVLNLELETERSVIIPRKEIDELLTFALNNNKRVILTSDMYLSKEIIARILDLKGIKGYERIIVSCDYQRAKFNGLYRSLYKLGKQDEKILHIGDNYYADGEAPKKYGIDTILLPSAIELAKRYGWQKPIEEANTLSERCLLGMTISEIFRDPFANPNICELPIEKRLERYAFSVVGPLLSGFVTWLLHQLKRDNYDGVMFMARDGWMVNEVYKSINPDGHLPQNLYFKANRHSSFMCMADQPEHVQRILEISKWYGLQKENILHSFLSMSPEEMKYPLEYESNESYVFRHQDQLNAIAERSREGYMKYSEKLGMVKGGKYAVVDFVASGTTQRYLSSFLPYKMIGTYFGNHQDKPEGYIWIDSYLQGDDDTLLNNYVELESFFSSPEPSIDHITGDGEIVYANEVRTEQDLNELQIVLDNSIRYAKEFFEKFYFDKSIRPIIPEEMYAADGFHYVQSFAYEDWPKVTIVSKNWNENVLESEK